MELTESELVFSPGLDFSSPNSFLNSIENILQDITYQGTLVKRVKRGGDEDYLVNKK